MLYFKKLAVNGTAPPPPRPIGAPVVPTKVAALLARWPSYEPPPNVTRDGRGTLHVPAVSFSHKASSAAVTRMKSFDEGAQLLYQRGDVAHPEESAVAYQVHVERPGTFYLTVNFSTWHVNQDLFVTTDANASAAISVPVYYTLGYWNQTQPLALQLREGANELTFTRSTERELAIKELLLYETRPDVPPPPSNYTPAPAPPPAAYIELPAATTCAKQGISEVPEQDCARACTILGFKFTGAKPRPNASGCFALTTGAWKDNCNYNTNKSAVCVEPPCTVEGSLAQALCLRK
jgi:hypothetical protein